MQRPTMKMRRPGGEKAVQEWHLSFEFAFDYVLDRFLFFSEIINLQGLPRSDVSTQSNQSLRFQFDLFCFCDRVCDSKGQTVSFCDHPGIRAMLFQSRCQSAKHCFRDT